MSLKNTATFAGPGWWMVLPKATRAALFACRVGGLAQRSVRPAPGQIIVRGGGMRIPFEIILENCTASELISVVNWTYWLRIACWETL